MKSDEIRTASDQDLVNQFVTYAEQHGAAILDGNVPDANRIFSRMEKLDNEFKARGIGTLSLLLLLLDDRETAVRYYAAIRLLAVAPARVRAVIEQVAAGTGPLAGDAGMGLREISSGRFKPG